MAELVKSRNTPEALGRERVLPVAAGAVGFAGGIAVQNAGNLEPGSTALGLVAVGRLEESYDNTGGANGDITGRVKAGIFPFENSTSTDEITRADIGNDCYIVDDQTVAKTNGTGTRSVAGQVWDVTSAGVLVRIGDLS